MLLDKISPKPDLVPVDILSAQRQIQSGPPVDYGARAPINGAGLVQRLVELQAPGAERWREDRALFGRINALLRSVLEDETVELAVPHHLSAVHVAIGDKVLPLENLGSGIAQLIVIAVYAASEIGHLICIEEPELHMHPLLLRRLVHCLRELTDNQYLITTHSAHLLDDLGVSVLRVSYSPEAGSTVSLALNDDTRAAISQHLGYRGSDLIQSNAIIWVEGPSDRILLRHWVTCANPKLVEGIHYSIMFYGGRLLAQLTGDRLDDPEGNLGDFISLLRINRKMAIVIDSDRRKAGQRMNATKLRIREEFVSRSAPVWVTAGSEIENYLPPEVFTSALKAVQPGSRVPEATHDRYERRYERVKNPRKIRAMEHAVQGVTEIWDVLDLKDRVRDLVSFIEEANHLRSPGA